MTLIEAVKAHLPFKRIGASEWISFRTSDFLVGLRETDITADDWIVKKEVTIDREKFIQAWKKAGSTSRILDIYNLGPDPFDVMKELGLRD